MQAICAARGMRYFHFLQPNRYVPGSKPLSTEELSKVLPLAHAWRRNAELGYPLLRARGSELCGRGVSFFDLTDMFVNETQTLYSDDCCHFNREGYARIARQIAAWIRTELDLGERTTGIRVQPESLVMADPVTRVRVTVEALTEDDRAFDVTVPQLGTHVAVDAARVEYLPGTGARALARGRGTMRVEARGRAVDVPFAADWPNVLTLADGQPDADGAALKVKFVADDPDGGTALVECAGHRNSHPWVVVVSPAPLPVVPRQLATTSGVASIPLTASLEQARVRVPWPVGPHVQDRPVFVRAYSIGARGEAVAVSNTLVLTRP